MTEIHEVTKTVYVVGSKEFDNLPDAEIEQVKDGLAALLEDASHWRNYDVEEAASVLLHKIPGLAALLVKNQKEQDNA